MRDDAAPSAKKEIPADLGLPIIGHTLELLNDPEGFGSRMRRTHGDIYRTRSFGVELVQMFGADANEFILMDREQNFSNELGWEPYLKRLFPRGLMLMDFDHHRAHRKIMATAFKTEPMKAYLATMGEAMPAYIDDWAARGTFKFYDAIKHASLELATTVFLGLTPDGEETPKINQALTDMVQASLALIRIPLPFTLMRKGVKGREYMIGLLRRMIPERRSGDGTDLLTYMCQAEDEDGNRFTDEQIIDHMIFLWMAAHDTITSSVTTLVYELGRNPDWQDKLREEVAALGGSDTPLSFDALGQMTLTEYAFKEALRINPPVPSMPRRAVRDFEFNGYKIAKGTTVGFSAVSTHRDETYWSDPMTFDPMRFAPSEESKKRHKFAWIPFGGGAHMCLGLHFAYMQAKLIMYHLLPHYRIVLPEGYKTRFQIMPLIRPKDGLPVTLEPLGD